MRTSRLTYLFQRVALVMRAARFSVRHRWLDLEIESLRRMPGFSLLRWERLPFLLRSMRYGFDLEAFQDHSLALLGPRPLENQPWQQQYLDEERTW